MKILYVKCMLYAYGHIKEVLCQIDDLVLKNALASMQNVSPCEEQCEKIIFFTERKKTILKLGLLVEDILDKFSSEDRLMIEYKYFRHLLPKGQKLPDIYSRNYYRRQNILLNKISRECLKRGFDDNTFKNNYLSIEFFRRVLFLIQERESMAKNLIYDKDMRQIAKCNPNKFSTCKRQNGNKKDQG